MTYQKSPLFLLSYKYNMRYKYATLTGTKQQGDKGHGRYVDPSRWITGPDPVLRDKYYAFLKHRSQARYRNEEYSLTWAEWQNYWTDQNWNNRGKTSTNVVLGRVDWSKGWHMDNVRIMTRKEHFAIKRGRKLDRS